MNDISDNDIRHAVSRHGFVYTRGRNFTGDAIAL